VEDIRGAHKIDKIQDSRTTRTRVDFDKVDSKYKEQARKLLYGR
jgi:predicted thioesterase